MNIKVKSLSRAYRIQVRVHKEYDTDKDDLTTADELRELLLDDVNRSQGDV